MWLKVLLEKFMDVAQSEQISRTVRIICTIFVSLVLILGIACLFLLAFLIGEAGLFRRAVSLILGIGILAYYVYFLKIVLRRIRAIPHRKMSQRLANMIY